MVLDNILGAIGRTPVVKFHRIGEDLHCELEKNRDFLKIRKNATKSHICKAKSFQK